MKEELVWFTVHHHFAVTLANGASSALTTLAILLLGLNQKVCS